LNTLLQASSGGTSATARQSNAKPATAPSGG
jgi:hypothetical protein